MARYHRLVAAFSPVESWLAHKMGFPAQQIDTPELRWAVLNTIGAPPALTRDIFLRDRGGACAKLNEVFSGAALQLQIGHAFPEQVVFCFCFRPNIRRRTRRSMRSVAVYLCKH